MSIVWLLVAYNFFIYFWFTFILYSGNIVFFFFIRLTLSMLLLMDIVGVYAFFLLFSVDSRYSRCFFKFYFYARRVWALRAFIFFCECINVLYRLLPLSIHRRWSLSFLPLLPIFEWGISFQKIHMHNALWQ